MEENRLKHSASVGRKMVEIGKAQGLDNNALQELFVLGYNHDVGYEFGDNKNHAEIGGLLLKVCGYKYWREIYYHGKSKSNYHSLYLDILNSADMQINSMGEDVGYNERLKDVAKRYGNKSSVYNECYELIDSLRKNDIS